MALTNQPFSPDSLIFDLDGTLWDTCPACAIAWNQALNDHAIPYRQILATDIRAVAGLPHEACIRTVFADLNPDQQQLLIEHTAKGDMQAIRQYGGELYPGVIAGLKQLAIHYPLYIVSNCQAGYIELFLELYQLADLFQDLECWGHTNRPKAENLQALISRNQLLNPVYIGDTFGDAAAAAACQIPFFHANWGYAQLPDVTSFQSFNKLTEWLLACYS